MKAPVGREEGEKGEGDIGTRQKHRLGVSIRYFESENSKRALAAALSQKPGH